MRIVAGSLRSRRLVAPRGTTTRPTSDRLREALFSAIGDVSGADVLDLFAGSGALGLEALSRGAARCTFCEVDAVALAALRENIASLGVGDRSTVRRKDARRLLRDEVRGQRRYHLLLVDPPYSLLQSFLPALSRHLGELAASGATIAIEHAIGHDAPIDGFTRTSRRRVGAAELDILIHAT